MNINIQLLKISLPKRFIIEKAEGLKCLMKFDFSTTHFFVRIENNACEVINECTETPGCIVNTTADVYIDIETGKRNAQLAFMNGDITVSNLPLMLQFGKLFRTFSLDEISSASISDIPSRKPEKGPLKGIRILDLSRLLPGPLATQLLAGLGAEVIKIENAESPDAIRNYPPLLSGQSVFYLALNSGKRSLTLDLYKEEDKALFCQLIQTADVVMESFRPGVMEKIGIDYEKMRTLNPRIIYVSVTGYGQSGPYAQAAGHDLNFIGYSGLLGMTGADTPIIPGGQVADVAGGAYMAVIATLTAMRNRDLTGKGEHVDVAMLDGLLPMMSLLWAESAQQPVQRGKALLSGGLPNYNIYKCKDEKWVALGALEPHFFRNFCTLIGKEAWMQWLSPVGNHPQLLSDALTATFLTRTRAEWMALVEGKDTCLTPVLAIEELSADPHLLHRNRFKTYHHPAYGQYQTFVSPLQFKHTDLPEGWPAPLLGEDNAAILASLEEKG